MDRWFPSVTLSKREQFLIGRMTRTGKLFAFLRQHRHELFDAAFQGELEGMYRTSGEGKQPVAPALLAMVLLLQRTRGRVVRGRGDEPRRSAFDRNSRAGPRARCRLRPLGPGDPGGAHVRREPAVSVAAEGAEEGADERRGRSKEGGRRRGLSARRADAGSRPGRDLPQAPAGREGRATSTGRWRGRYHRRMKTFSGVEDVRATTAEEFLDASIRPAGCHEPNGS
jgi:hypothetical protein